ncbi:hypothetical protein PR003_g3865 [Phytophthora rubi]|uniref:Uncharacterized protein n=1 Tax=Phytophthora rubi TaxID=129364 RepID=A0A6A3P829_9STRA|nr:hypothetical protein PR002_g4494 [Phytophthora rubi]KAE9048913.1 hypothetical protein PR001_g3652 [Phytophthora rubi]KAE9353422.1 hypothetical protein PR003_g3865 [Phytophthora rubi]
MIRPVSHLHMQRVGQPQLKSPRKPWVNTLLPPSSPLKSSPTISPKSPIKKHLQNASAFASETSSVGTTASDEALDHVSGSQLHGPLKAKLRASVLQAVLRLLDQDVNALTGAHEVLQAVAALPLAEPKVQRACVEALRELQDAGSSSLSMPPSFVYNSGSMSNSNWDEYEAPVPPPSPRKLPMQTRNAKGLTTGSLHHCKEFLLACASEICELEDDHPVPFDYAEDSNLAQRTVEKMCKHCGTANFDYASTVQESSCESDNCSNGEDDTRADQGSQFSEVLHRAEYMSDEEEEEEASDVETQPSMSMRDRAICRQILRGLHEYVQSQRRRSSAPSLAVKFRVFEALKLRACFTRKRLAFQRLKTGLGSRPQQHSTPKNFVVSKTHTPSTTFMLSLQTLLEYHSDLLLLLVALVFLANLPAKYIM